MKININKCTTFGNINKYSTRNKNQLYVPKWNLQCYHSGPIITSIKLYNRLPEEIKKIENLTKFKRQIKAFLTVNAIYSIDEYLSRV